MDAAGEFAQELPAARKRHVAAFEKQPIGLGMRIESSNYPESRLPKVVELRWQREVIERWLDCSGTSPESQAELQEMLTRVDAELETLEASHRGGCQGRTLKQTG